jgi:hypothetical protein
VTVEELQLYYILLAPLLAFVVCSLVLLIVKTKKSKQISSSLRLPALINFSCLLVALLLYFNLFQRTTFRFLHGNGTVSYHVKGDKSCYSQDALDCIKENPGISDDDLISLCFSNPVYKKWVWEENCIRKNFIWLVIGYCGVMVLLSAFVALLAEYLARKPAKTFLSVTDETDDDSIRVFISYSHADSEIAKRLKSKLEKEQINVILDAEAMLAGEEISAFIHRSILRSQVTISIISRESLLSGWVALETVSTFFLQKFSRNRHFIACFVNSDFLDSDFVLEAVGELDIKLAEVNARINKQNRINVDTRNLNDEKSRLLLLRNNFDDILYRLKNSLQVDISPGHLENNFPLLLKSIKAFAEATDS